MRSPPTSRASLVNWPAWKGPSGAATSSLKTRRSSDLWPATRPSSHLLMRVLNYIRPMSALRELADGGYDFLEGVFPYSQGVIAREGFSLERAQFPRPLPLAEGFAAIASHLAALGRPRTALCATELRSPRPFTFDGFREFNRGYVAVLEDWGLLRGGLTPVARSNVVPEVAPPAAPGFHAFCYTVPAASARRDFVVAGSGEWPEGGRFPEDIVARGDASPAGLGRKVRYVLAVMASRLAGLGAHWRDAS